MSHSLNDPSSPLSAVRSPRFRLLANGEPIPGAIEVEIESNNHFQPDTFSAEVALFADTTHRADFWGNNDTITIEIQAGFATTPDAVLPTLFIGEVDHVELDPIGGTVRIQGRDLSRRLIDTKTQQNYQNLTSSEIATKLAVEQKLIPVVAPTTTLVSRYYALDHDHLSLDQFSKTITEWDLLVYLADLEGFDVFVTGLELHFQPATAETDPPYIVRLDRSAPQPVCNVQVLHMSRSLTLAKDIEVWVRSWNAHTKSGFTKKAGGKASGSKGDKDATPRRVVITRPNMTEDAAQQLANNKRKQLTQHERLIEFDLPGDLRPNARDRVRVEGTNSSWDQSYYVSSVHRRIGWESGYAMTVHAKNSSPANETIPF